MNEFKGVTVGQARWIAEKADAERILVIAVGADGYSITSYGKTVADCRRLKAAIEMGEFGDVARKVAEA